MYLVVPALAFAAALGALAMAAGAPAPAPLVTMTPPPTGVARPFANADDHGALTLLPVQNDAFQVTSYSRDGHKRWRTTFRFPLRVIGCGPCPDALVATPTGGIGRWNGSRLQEIPTPGTPDPTGGLPGAGPNANRLIWTSRSRSGAFRAYAVSALIRRRLPLTFPVDSAAENGSQLAVDAAGRRGVLISMPNDPLLIGSRRLLEVTRSGVSVDQSVDVRLPSVGAPGYAAACIDPSGTFVAALVPHLTSQTLLASQFGSSLASRGGLPMASTSAVGCAVMRSGTVISFGASNDVPGRVRIEWTPREGSSIGRNVSVGGGAIRVDACDRSALVVVVGALETAIVSPGRLVGRNYRSLSGGCTEEGTPWILTPKGRIRWLSG